MTWMIFLGAWLGVASALALVLGRAIRLAEERHLSQDVRFSADRVQAVVGAGAARVLTLDRADIPRPR